MALKREFNAIKRVQFPWVFEVTKSVCEGAFTNLGNAFANYYNCKNGTRKGTAVSYPQFKSKKRCTQSFGLANDRFDVDGHWIRIQKLGRVNMAEPLRFSGKIMGAVVSCSAGKWYVSIKVEVEKPVPVRFAKSSVGVDVGLKTLATLSDGRQYENQALLRYKLNRLCRLSRQLSRRQQGSKRWWRAKWQLARFHERTRNRRMDAIHKMTHEIASTYRIVGVEDLHVKGMFKNRRLALSIADAAMGEVLRQLAYKCAWFGGVLQRVGRYFPSSKTCSACGVVNRDVTLADRTWVCVDCGTAHDRDDNASVNIEQEALRLLGASSASRPGVATSGVIARGQDVRPELQAILVETSTFAYFEY